MNGSLYLHNKKNAGENRVESYPHEHIQLKCNDLEKKLHDISIVPLYKYLTIKARDFVTSQQSLWFAARVESKS